MNQTATTIVEEFEAEFYSTINNQTLEELAFDYGMTLNGRSSVENLIENIGDDFLLALFQHEAFRDLPILGIYKNDDIVCLLLEAVDAGKCCNCNCEVIVYASVLVTADGGIDFGYYGVPANGITPVRKKRVRDALKMPASAWKERNL